MSPVPPLGAPGAGPGPGRSAVRFDHRAPRWLPGGHLQTIWAARLARTHDGPDPVFRRERWDTPDGDFIDVDFLVEGSEPFAGPAYPQQPPSPQTALAIACAKFPSDAGAAFEPPDRAAPMLVLFHGLEGSSQGHYSLALAEAAQARGWRFAVPHFRGCSGELNRAPRAYHSGDHAEIDWILTRLRERAGQPVRVVGVSLGGNALLRWAAEAGAAAADRAQAVAAVCSPLDLGAAGAAIDRGFNRQVYARMFLATMKPKALAKARQFPGLFDEARVRAATTLRTFDDAFTAPLHGFAGVDDYWVRASARPHLSRIRIPALALNALNDPFIPAASLPQLSELGDWVTAWRPPHGGHVGFAEGRLPGHLRAMPQAVLDWMVEAAA